MNIAKTRAGLAAAMLLLALIVGHFLLAITNSLGFVGRYQVDAGWFADAGYVDSEKLHAAMAKDGFTRESTWGVKGYMTVFLNAPANWKNGLSLDQYKTSADLQDTALRS